MSVLYFCICIDLQEKLCTRYNMLSFKINNCVIIIIFNKTNMLQMSKYLLNNFNLGLSAHCVAIYACIQQLLCKKIM